jgi:hypothetical protein
MNVFFLLPQLCKNMPLMDSIFPSRKILPSCCCASVDFKKVFHFPSHRQMGPKFAEETLTEESSPELMGRRGTEWHRST